MYIRRLFLAMCLFITSLQGEYESPCPEELPVYDCGYPLEYERYPGIAYEEGYTTTQIATTVVIGIAFVAVVAILLATTPQCHRCKHHHHKDHHHRRDK